MGMLNIRHWPSLKELVLCFCCMLWLALYPASPCRLVMVSLPVAVLSVLTMPLSSGQHDISLFTCVGKGLGGFHVLCRRDPSKC